MRHALIALVLLPLAACGGGDKDEAPTPDAPPAETGSAVTVPAEQQPLPEIVSPLADAAPLTPGVYCYYRNDENVTEGVSITVSEDGGVSGSNFGIIHQRAADYFAAFSTELSNGNTGESAAVTFDTVTKVDGDTQTSNAVWYLGSEGAVPDGLDIMLKPADCDGLEERVQTEGSP